MAQTVGIGNIETSVSGRVGHMHTVLASWRVRPGDPPPIVEPGLDLKRPSTSHLAERDDLLAGRKMSIGDGLTLRDLVNYTPLADNTNTNPDYSSAAGR